MLQYLYAEGDNISETGENPEGKCSFNAWINHLFQTLTVMKP